ncbi:MAG: amidohydrolase family protein [Victivallales bacterium]|nr:amidohydrolase family protein [Victivallales bacterium]
MERTALVNGKVIDGTGKSLNSAAIIIENGIIVSVETQKRYPSPENHKIIDLRGKTVLPLLVDGHMHLSGEPGRLDHLGHVRGALLALGKLQESLRWGTGLVAHAAGSQESVILRDVILSGQQRDCADMLVGTAVTSTCGHVRGMSADGPWEIRKAVRESIAAGADHIKTCASGGFQWDHEKLTHEDYTLEELRALTEIAHSRDKRVHVHAHAQPGLRNAIDAGCDVILHGALIDDDALEGIAKRGLWYMPTLHITSETAREGKNWPPYMTERMKEAHPIHMAGVSKAREMGIRVVTGTDGGPGSIMNELRLLVECGFSELEAITAATSATAEALGALDKTGTIEPGKKADLLVIDGDPIKDITTLSSKDSIFMVMKNGRIQMTGDFDPN